MKFGKSILSVSAGVLLAFGGMAIATPQQASSAAKQTSTKAQAKAAHGVSQGTITSIDKDQLVMSHKGKEGKTENMTFALSDKTERKGDLKVGAKVSVHYTSENNQFQATSIQASPEKTASSTAKK